MTQHEVEQIADAAARRAVHELLATLGIDVTDVDALRQMQADMLFLRAWRESAEAVKRKALLTAIGVVVTGALGWVFAAVGWRTVVGH